MFALDAVVLGATLVDISTVVIIAVVAFIVGLLLAFLMVTPARSASNHLARDRERRIKQLDDQVHDLQDRNEQLREQNASVAAERNHLRGQLDALRQHNVAAASTVGVASAANPDGAGTQAARDQAQRADQQAAADQQAQAEQQAQADQQPRQESLGERIKDFFSGNNPDNTNAPNPNATA